jgi:hypothetical protein
MPALVRVIEGTGIFLAAVAAAWLVAIGIVQLLWWTRLLRVARRSRRRQLTRWRCRRVMWLARRAEWLATRRRRGGDRGPLGRGALRFLARLAARYSVIRYPDWEPWPPTMDVTSELNDVLWRAWLAGPEERIWTVLPPYVQGRVFAEAVNPARSAAERAAIGAFCAAHGQAPPDTAERAMFYVLTGQLVQHRAADPDGALLAVAFRRARGPARVLVRQTLVEAGDLDLIGVIAGTGRDRPAAITADEAGYLIGQLAGQRDWAVLWELAQDLPAASAVAALARFPDGWQPAGERDQALFSCLAHVSAKRIARARNSLNPRRMKRGRLSRWRASGNRSGRDVGPDPRAATVTELADRPQSSLKPSDLATIAVALRDGTGGPAARPLLELLAAILDCRFGAEVALGTAAPLQAGADDIALKQ